MKKKIFVVYRVLQHWRAPVFEKIGHSDKYNLTVVYGPDFPGTKIVSSKTNFDFRKKRMFSFKLKFNSSNGIIAMPFSPFLFFYLCFSQPGIIITEGASNLINAFQAFIYCKLFRKRFIWWSLGKVQGREYDVKRKRLDNYIVGIEKKSDAIITYSSVGKQYFNSLGIPNDKIFVAVNVIDTSGKLQHLKKLDVERIRTEFHENSIFNILFVGAVTKEKNIEILIKAFSQLEDKYADCYLFIVGNGNYLDEIKRLAAQLNIKNIKFPGHIEKGVEDYFIGSDVFVLPGLGGLAISEAMVYGLPVIASIGDGCEADLIDSSNGFLDINLDTASLFKYLEELYLDRNLLDTMKKNSQLKIINKYNIESYLAEVYKAIDAS